MNQDKLTIRIGKFIEASATGKLAIVILAVIIAIYLLHNSGI